MKRVPFILGAVVAALTVSVASASARHLEASWSLSLGVTPDSAARGDQFTLAGALLDDGQGSPNREITLYESIHSNCSSSDAVGSLETDAAGMYSKTFTVLGIASLGTHYFQAVVTAVGDGAGTASACMSLEVTAESTPPTGNSDPPTVRPSVIREDDNSFYCYSRFEQDSGMTFSVRRNAALLAAGYWKPFAIRGTAPPGYATAGSYYLSCNPPASMKETERGVGLDGFVYDYSAPGQDYLDDLATVFDIVA